MALGETSSTAYRGDRGKIAYDHSQSSGNPHGTTFAQLTGTASVAQIPNLPASKITSGIFDIARIPTGTTGTTVALGNDSRINNGQTAFSWGNHSSAGYVPNSRTITAGTGISGGGNLTANRTISLDTTYTDDRYLQRSGGSMVNTNLVSNLNSEYISGVSLSNLARGGYASYSSGTTSGWKRVLVINGTSSASGIVSGSLMIGKTYSYGYNETYHINFNATYGSNATEFNNKADIVKVSGSDGTMITKVRVVSAVNTTTITPAVAVDVYYQASSIGSNNIIVQYWGGNASQGELLSNWEDAPATISSPYISKEINFARRGYVGDLITANTFYGALSGNSSTATSLQTSRTIWGQSFNGTGNVSGALSGVTSITSNNWFLNDSTTNPFLRLTTGGTNYYAQATSSGIGIGAGMANSLVVAANGVTTINNNTNLALDLGMASSNYIRASKTNGYIGFIVNGQSSVQLSNSPLVIHSTGNVRVGLSGAGSTVPTQALHVFGNALATGELTAFTTSDARLKEDIKPIQSSLETIDKLNPVSYKWSEKAFELNSGKTKGTDYGLIAQEVEEVIPEVVHNMYDGEYKGIDYIKLVPFLIGAIKELDQEIKTLKEKIDNYEKNNSVIG